MRNDRDIQRDIEQEFRWDPRLRDADLAVGVNDGVVTLGGSAHSLADKLAAENAAGRIKGVRAVANEITVALAPGAAMPDAEIARAAMRALSWNASVPDEHIQVMVDSGWVRLEGEVDWYFQKEQAEKAVRVLRGVRGVSNLLTTKPRPVPSDVKTRITNSLHRGARFDADQISVEVVGHTVTLRGTVRSFAEKRDAVRATRNAPGVQTVDDQLTIDPYVLVPL